MTKIANESLKNCMARPRRAVLHLLTGRVFGGAEEHALSILTAMRSHGFEPCLAAPGALIDAMEPELSAAGVNCLPLEFSSRLDVLTGARLLRSSAAKTSRFCIAICSLPVFSEPESRGWPASARSSRLVTVPRFGGWEKACAPVSGWIGKSGGWWTNISPFRTPPSAIW
jgi:hypothetical protein